MLLGSPWLAVLAASPRVGALGTSVKLWRRLYLSKSGEGLSERTWVSLALAVWIAEGIESFAGKNYVEMIMHR